MVNVQEASTTRTFYGVACVGSRVAWHRGGRYPCLIVGVVDSITPTGVSLRITVLKADRRDVRPGDKLTAAAENCVVV